MQQRGLRFAILSLLLVSGALAGYYIWSGERRLQELDEQQRSKADTIGRLQASIATITTAQQAYADYGRRDAGTFARVALLVDRMTTDAAGLRASADSQDSVARLEEFWAALSGLMGAESRARENFAAGDTESAADGVLGAARDYVSTLGSSLRAFRQTELDSYLVARGSTVWRTSAALCVAAALWAFGLVAFAVVPLRPEGSRLVVVPAAVVEAAPLPDPAPTVDLSATASAAVELARLSDQAEFAAWLGRVAALLEARGVILWMGSGDALFAASAYGYDESMLQRIPPIARTAANATADAWRSGELRTVAADASGYGAIVAPMPGPSGCAGVLAAEVRSGRERDAATCAVATVLASQLSSVLAAWPAASTISTEDAGLNRQTAAS